MNEKTRKGRHKLTNGVESGDNPKDRGAMLHLSPADPRIIALVRMLARHSAERDYARHVRRNGTAHTDLPEEE